MDTSNRPKKSTNPLYVVSKNGVDVEAASGILELLMKKTGLDKLMPMLQLALDMILSQVQTYAVFIEVKKMFDQLFEKAIELLFQIQQMTQKKKA